jgi:hypothetical protein
MTLENSRGGNAGDSLNECDCVFFTVLPLPDQIKNREYREAAKSGKEIPGIFTSICGSCITSKRIQEAIVFNNLHRNDRVKID